MEEVEIFIVFMDGEEDPIAVFSHEEDAKQYAKNMADEAHLSYDDVWVEPFFMQARQRDQERNT